MSRRFGRNQRRRAREALAGAQKQIEIMEVGAEMYRLQLAELRSRLAAAEDHDREVAALVGWESIIVRGEVDEKDYQNMKREWLDGQLRVIPYQPLRFRSSLEARSESIDYVRDEIVHLLEVEAVRDIFSRRMEFRIRFYGNELGYGVSESALHNMPKKQLSKKITDALSGMLLSKLRGSA